MTAFTELNTVEQMIVETPAGVTGAAESDGGEQRGCPAKNGNGRRKKSCLLSCPFRGQILLFCATT